MQELGYIKYLGKNILLQGEIDKNLKRPIIEWSGNGLFYKGADFDQATLTKALTKFYKKECRRVVKARIKTYQPLFKEKVKSVTIESSKVRWGSCNGNKELTFHWQLILYPVEALEYVVIHEMCHMSHLNHDRSFWRLVGKHCPNYKETMKIIGSEKTRGI